MVKANEWFKKHLAPDGLITTAGGWQMLSLIDWGYPLVSFKERGELATLNLIYYKYLRSVERIAAELGENPISQTFQRQADSLRETINRTYFSPEEARYYDKPGHQAPSPFASTLAVEYGVVPPADRRKVFEYAVGPALRPGKASPWFMYEVLEAFAIDGRYEDAVSAIKRYWGTFLQAGATTLWELWNLPGENVIPLPHIPPEVTGQTITYAGGPAPYIVNHILGVQPLRPGFAETLIAPHFSGLNFADGKAPTPLGDVRVGWQRMDASNQTEIFLTVPEGMKAILRLPYSPEQRWVRLNDELLYDGEHFQPLSAVAHPQANEGFLELQIAPGEYYFRASND